MRHEETMTTELQNGKAELSFCVLLTESIILIIVHSSRVFGMVWIWTTELLSPYKL